jgi:hypothetical protein
VVINPWSKPNAANAVIGRQAAAYREAVGRGLVRVPVLNSEDLKFGATRLEPFQFSAAQTVAAPSNTAVNWVLNFEFDKGFNGLINGIWHDYPQGPGSGFTDGDGGLLWLLAVDWRYVPNYGATGNQLGMQQRLGSRGLPFAIPGIPIFAGQRLQYGYMVPLASGAATGGSTIISVGVTGYKFPATRNT